MQTDVHSVADDMFEFTCGLVKLGLHRTRQGDEEGGEAGGSGIIS